MLKVLKDCLTLRLQNRLCLNYPVNINRKACKIRNLRQPFQVSNYPFFVISSSNNWKIANFSVQRSFSRLNSMSKDDQRCRLCT